MSLKKPLVITNGQIEQLQSGDTLDATVAEIELISATNDNAGSVVIGTPVYMKSNGNVDKGRANSQSTVQIVAFVKDTSISTSATGNFQTAGALVATTTQWDSVTGETGGLTPGGVYYLDPSTAGKMTQTAPTTASQFVVRLGTALASTEFDIEPMPPIKL